jgi:hypothetical protein
VKKSLLCFQNSRFILTAEDFSETRRTQYGKINNLRECQFGNLFSTTRKITKKKFEDLQQIKLVIPKDCWPFYDALMTL